MSGATSRDPWNASLLVRVASSFADIGAQRAMTAKVRRVPTFKP